MENETNVELLERKANHYLKAQIKIHVSYINGKWMRGLIKEVSSDFFILDETLNGMMPIFFLEIKDIEPYKEKTREDKNGH